MDRAADVAGRVRVEIRERRILLAGLMIRQRVIPDGVLGHLGQRDVLAHVIEVGAVVLPHDEELARVPEYSGTDARLLEPRVLLHDGDVPAIELAKLGVALLHNFLPARNVEGMGCVPLWQYPVNVRKVLGKTLILQKNQQKLVGAVRFELTTF